MILISAVSQSRSISRVKLQQASVSGSPQGFIIGVGRGHQLKLRNHGFVVDYCELVVACRRGRVWVPTPVLQGCRTLQGCQDSPEDKPELAKGHGLV